jgi:serine/threonine protein kinase
LIGAGTFGEVYLAQACQQNHGGNSAIGALPVPVAIKVLKKRQVLDEGQLSNALAEKAILSEVEHPFITSL